MKTAGEVDKSCKKSVLNTYNISDPWWVVTPPLVDTPPSPAASLLSLSSSIALDAVAWAPGTNICSKGLPLSLGADRDDDADDDFPGSVNVFPP